VLEDLIAASRSEQVQDMFAQLRIQATAESVSSVFERYIYDAIRKYPTLNHPTRLDFGSARIIVLNLQEVAPRGSAAAERQTEMMYMLGRHILARNFFLRQDYVHYVPEAVRPYHAKRFREAYETVKRLDYDEWHRHLVVHRCAPRQSSTPVRAASTTSNSASQASDFLTWATH
jgi:intracellular multiplication protein IcmB